MTIKGTLETLNLLDLMQMLSFNQKVGTLRLETARGPRTLYVEAGAFGFVQGDPLPSRALARVLRRTSAVPADRLARAITIATNSGRFLGDALADLGVLDAAGRAATASEAIRELFFDLLQTSIARFEFLENKRLAPDGSEGTPIQPMCAVDAVLLELTHRLDEWALLRRQVPSEDEVFATRPGTPDVRALEDVAACVPERVLPLIDGTRTVRGLVEDSDCDRFQVVKLVAHLLGTNAIEPASKEDLVSVAERLLAGGAPAKAVPLLRLVVERGGAAPAVRLRLAEALAASGDRQGAAAELDACAAACEDADPLSAFEALHRALLLREGDAPTAARLCDHYLRHTARLRPRSADAGHALRSLIEAATAGGRAGEAAARLAQFIDKGEAPGEDLLVLADLWAAAGRPAEASSALVRRADRLSHEGRLGPARDLLRRAVAYDPTRLDVRRRLADLEGAERRRRHRRRMTILLSLAALVGGTAGTAYLVYDGRAAREAEGATTQAEMATRAAEAKVQGAVAQWRKVLDSEPADSAVLAEAAQRLRAEVERVATALRADLAASESSLTSSSSTNHAEGALARVRALQGRAAQLAQASAAAVREAGDRAERALEAGEKAYGEGQFHAARPLLEQAQRLSFDDPPRASRARKNLEQVDVYVAGFARARQPYDEACARGDLEAAWREGCHLLAQFLDSDMTREVLLPVPVTTDPAGVDVRLGESGTSAPSPTLLRYSPFGDLALHLRAQGHVPKVVRLPSFREIRDAEARGGHPPFHVSETMDKGPRWFAPAPRVAAGPFLLGELPCIVDEDGRTMRTVHVVDGTTSEARGIAAVADKVRAMARERQCTWMLLGLRTFQVMPEAGPTWQYLTPGRLTKRPAFSRDLVVLADETGVLHALEAATGAPRWRGTLPSAPLQAPCDTPLGFVVATVGGEVAVAERGKGAVTLLLKPETGRTDLVAPWKEGVLVIGGAAGLRYVGPRREESVLGAADPETSIAPVLDATGCAWVERSGVVRFLPRTDGAAPVDVTGAGRTSLPPALMGGVVYTVGTDGVLRAARPEEEGRTLWSAPLFGEALAEPIVAGDVVIVRTTSGLAAYER